MRLSFILLVTTASFLLTGCNKFLDKKPSLGMFVPSTIEDLQALLDNNNIINQQMGNSLVELIADNYYIKPKDLPSFSVNDRANYLWKNDAQMLDNWRLNYESPIYYSNLVLDGLKIISDAPADKVAAVKGAALFIRAFSFFQLAQVYCKPYSPNSENELGIVLRATSDIEAGVKRSTVRETYDKIIDDLKLASALLPNDVPTTMRPSKNAAYALLSRVYLNMSNYLEAEKYADTALEIKNDLIDYNELQPQVSPKLPLFAENPEIIYFNALRSNTILSGVAPKIDSNLATAYGKQDIRSRVFLIENTGENKGTYRFNGSYFSIGNGQIVFNGLTTAELYLIKAECLIRRSNVLDAVDWINKLLIKRYETGFAVSYPTEQAEVKNFILLERRKELIYRGIRWSDIRRLNLEEANITLTRKTEDGEFTLPSNDMRSVLLIPIEEISRSGIPQNPR